MYPEELLAVNVKSLDRKCFKSLMCIIPFVQMLLLLLLLLLFVVVVVGSMLDREV